MFSKGCAPLGREGLAQSEVVPPAADRMAQHAEQCQNRADHKDNNPDGPDNSYFGYESNYQQDDAENNQLVSSAILAGR